MEKKTTISDVAKYVGVSKSTVSQYINGNHQKMSADTRKKIQNTIEDLNYRPSKQAQFLTTRKSNLIGVVVADISNMYSSLLLKGITSINQPSKLIGATVAETIDMLLKGTPTNKIDVPTIIKSEIHWRNSL